MNESSLSFIPAVEQGRTAEHTLVEIINMIQEPDLGFRDKLAGLDREEKVRWISALSLRPYYILNDYLNYLRDD